MKTIVICSGGLDSVSLAHMVAANRKLTGLVSFDYGQRHRKELDYAALCAKRLDVPHDIIDMRGIGAALTGSALTDDVDVPDGHYAEETMRVTVVPNRNAIMLTVAYGIAAARGDQAVATAVHGAITLSTPTAAPISPKRLSSCNIWRWTATLMCRFTRLSCTAQKRIS